MEFFGLGGSETCRLYRDLQGSVVRAAKSMVKKAHKWIRKCWPESGALDASLHDAGDKFDWFDNLTKEELVNTFLLPLNLALALRALMLRRERLPRAAFELARRPSCCCVDAQHAQLLTHSLHDRHACSRPAAAQHCETSPFLTAPEGSLASPQHISVSLQLLSHEEICKRQGRPAHTPR